MSRVLVRSRENLTPNYTRLPYAMRANCPQIDRATPLQTSERRVLLRLESESWAGRTPLHQASGHSGGAETSVCPCSSSLSACPSSSPRKSFTRVAKPACPTYLQAGGKKNPSHFLPLVLQFFSRVHGAEHIHALRNKLSAVPFFCANMQTSSID